MGDISVDDNDLHIEDEGILDGDTNLATSNEALSEDPVSARNLGSYLKIFQTYFLNKVMLLTVALRKMAKKARIKGFRKAFFFELVS